MTQKIETILSQICYESIKEKNQTLKLDYQTRLDNVSTVKFSSGRQYKITVQRVK